MKPDGIRLIVAVIPDGIFTRTVTDTNGPSTRFRSGLGTVTIAASSSPLRES